MRIKSRGGAAAADLDMTPMIDMTFQLITFFMFTMNFNNETFTQEVKLPIAGNAQKVAPSEGRRLFLNIDGKGQLLAPGDPIPLRTRDGLAKLTKYLYDERERVSRMMFSEGKDPRKGLDATIVIRADARSEYGWVQDVIRIARTQGFSHFSLRALDRKG